jgi:RimJ/RimL family protein N-acetyltransferase
MKSVIMPVDEIRPLGRPVPGFVPPPRPLPMTLGGRTVTVAPLRTEDAPALFSAFHGADAMWDYMPIGPFETEADLADWIAQVENSEDPLFFTFTPVGEAAAGFGSYLRIAPEAASIEVGYLSFSPAATQRRGDGGDVPDDEMGLRGRVSPLRVEV